MGKAGVVEGYALMMQYGSKSLKKDNQIRAQDFVILSRMQIYMQINYRPTLSAKRGYFD